MKIAGAMYLEFIRGMRNLRSISGWVFSNTNTPPQTRTNANNVPMLVRSVTSTRFINSDGMATTNPATIVENHGVLNRGWIEENIGGNNPSRLIDIQIRG